MRTLGQLLEAKKKPVAKKKPKRMSATDRLWHEHDKALKASGAKVHNYGWSQEDDHHVASKTSHGILNTSVRGRHVRHHWSDDDE